MARSVTAARGGSSRNRGILMLAVIFGLLSAVLMFAFLRSQGGGSGTEGLFDDSLQAQSVVVASRDIAPGERITSDMLTVKTLPGSAVLPGVYESPATLEGQVATTLIIAGEQMIPQKITTFEGQNSLSFKVPDGLRAVTLMVPHEAWIVGGHAQPGDRVDFVAITTLVTVDPLTGQEKIDFITGIIAENIEVLAAAQTTILRVANPGASDDGTGIPGPSISGGVVEEAGTFETSISLTLALTPELAAKVALIDAMRDDDGQYRLILRQKGDETVIGGRPVWTIAEIFPSTN